MLGLSKPYFTFAAIKSAMTLVLRRKGIAKIMVIIMVIIIVKVSVIMTTILKITNNNINYFIKTKKIKFILIGKNNGWVYWL